MIDTRLEVYKLFQKGDVLSTRDVANILGITQKRAWSAIQALISAEGVRVVATKDCRKQYQVADYVCDESLAPVLMYLRISTVDKTLAEISEAVDEPLELVEEKLERLIKQDFVDWMHSTKVVKRKAKVFFPTFTETYEPIDTEGYCA